MPPNLVWIVVGWALVGAALGRLATPISRRYVPTGQTRTTVHSYAAFMVTTSILFGLLAWRFGAGLELLAYSCLATVAVPLAAIDLTEHRLPHALVTPLYPASLTLFGVVASVDDQASAFFRAAAGMAVLVSAYAAVAVLSRGGLGAGDVRLAGPVGFVLAWHGWPAVAAGTAMTLICAQALALTMITTRRATRHTPVPLGPAMLAGMFTTVLMGG